MPLYGPLSRSEFLRHPGSFSSLLCANLSDFSNIKKTKQIAFAANLSEISGVDTVHFTLAKALSTLGVETHFLPLGFSSAGDSKIPKCSTTHSIRTPRLIHRILHPKGSQWARYSMQYFKEKVQKYLANQGAIWWVPGHLNYLWLENPPEGCRQLGIIHAPDPGNLDAAEKFHHLWDACVAVSEESAEKCIRRIPELSDKMTVIVNGIELPKHAVPKSNQTLRIIWCGRIEQAQKRVLDLVQIAHGLERSGCDWHLDIVGTGELEAELKSEMLEHISHARVSLHGRLPSNAVYTLMEASDVVLLVSNYEGTPMVLLEGMARGCVPVSSKGCGGAIEMMQNAFPQSLFETGDIKGAVQALTSLALAPDIKYQRRMETMKILKQSDHCADAMAQAYERVLFE